MSKYSKSVSFEEYRQKSWRDVCKMLEEENRQGRANNVGGGDGDYFRKEVIGSDVPPPPKIFLDDGYDNGRTGFHSNKSSSIFEDSIPPYLPPPLEPDRVSSTVSYPDVVRNVLQGQTNELNNNYIMPSSLGPLPVSNSYSFVVLPPPSPFNDDYPDKNRNHRYEPNGKDGFSGGNEVDYDIIEIKSPRRENFYTKESTSGLITPPQLASPRRKHREDKISSEWGSTLPPENLYQSASAPVQHKAGMRAGLFELPEVYSPPPLRPPQQQRTTSTITTPSQLSRVMPSFVQNTFNSPRQQKPLPSPRSSYSEPIMKSERGPYLPSDGQLPTPTIGPEPSSATRNPITISSRKADARQEKSHPYGAPVIGQNSEVRSPRCLPKPKSTVPFSGDGTGIRRTLSYEHNSDPHLLGNVGNEVVPGGTDNFRYNGGGGGDHSEETPRLTKHNCLSPRARSSTLIQPSVITPAVSESILMECIANLKSPHWENNYEAFSQIFSLTEIHPDKVRNILNRIIWHGLPHLSSPRSKLARMACICFKRLFQTQKRNMEMEGEKVFYRLLDLSGGLSNNFIQQESKDALLTAVENMDPLRSISFLELHGSKHKNPHVREFTAYLLTAIMDELPQSRLMNNDFSPRIIPMIVNFIREGFLQTRLHGKLALDKIFDHPTFDCKLKRFVSPENVRHIADVLREFRERRHTIHV